MPGQAAAHAIISYVILRSSRMTLLFKTLLDEVGQSPTSVPISQQVLAKVAETIKIRVWDVTFDWTDMQVDQGHAGYSLLAGQNVAVLCEVYRYGSFDCIGQTR